MYQSGQILSLRKIYKNKNYKNAVQVEVSYYRVSYNIKSDLNKGFFLLLCFFY